MAAAALCRILTPTLTPTLLLRRQLLLCLLSTQPQPVQTTTPAELSRLKSSIRSVATTQDALASLFFSALPHPAFLADRPLFSLSVHRLASAGRQDIVASMLSSSLTSLPAPHPSEGFLIRLISLYAAAGKPDHSLSTFRLVTPPSDRALSAYHDNRQYDRAVHAFRTLPAKLGIKPRIVSHNILVKSLVAGGDVASARAVFDEMPDKASVEPDIVSCNEILKGYLNSGDTSFLIKEYRASHSTTLALQGGGGFFIKEEVELDRKVVDRKVRLTAVTTEVRKKESGELVAIGRQWMMASRPKGSQGSKL